MRRGLLAPVAIEERGRVEHWAEPAALEAPRAADDEIVHLLSPFDPLIIQRRRLKLFFDYEHRFEAYVPKEKRIFGYFSLPILVGDEIVAVMDLKADRQNKEMQINQWTWIGRGRSSSRKARIEELLDRFAQFQFPS